jgi:hypothetical protein
MSTAKDNICSPKFSIDDHRSSRSEITLDKLVIRNNI